MKRGRRKPSSGQTVRPGADLIVGRNAVLEVLRGERRKVWRVRIARGAREAGSLAAIAALAERRGIPIERTARQDLGSDGDKTHGVAAEADPYPYVTVEDVLLESERRGESAFLLLLDALQDPQNLGTILRTAEAVGVHGVVIPYSRAVGVTPAVVRASSGATEHLLIAAANLATSMTRLREAGVRLIGLEAGEHVEPLTQLDLGGALGLVVGSEGEGLRRLVRERCDVVAGLPMRGRIGSLNAAVAGSIALYLAAAVRGGAGPGWGPAASGRPSGGPLPSRGIDAPSEA